MTIAASFAWRNTSTESSLDSASATSPPDLLYHSIARWTDVPVSIDSGRARIDETFIS